MTPCQMSVTVLGPPLLIHWYTLGHPFPGFDNGLERLTTLRKGLTCNYSL